MFFVQLVNGWLVALQFMTLLHELSVPTKQAIREVRSQYYLGTLCLITTALTMLCIKD
jgi:hypothetical protein